MFNIGDQFEGVLLETCIDKNISRPRVRPINSLIFPEDIRVEFPRSLRDDNPIGTRFRADIKVSQKTEKATGQLKGPPYLVADAKTIELSKSFIPDVAVKAVKLNTLSDRVYKYLNDSALVDTSFNELRRRAYEGANLNPERLEANSTSIARSQLIVIYALTRANGNCEGCDDPAPFLRMNGDPYLEVHHILDLAYGGSDSPSNVIALCPNCHRRVTYGQDRQEYNDRLLLKVVEFEGAIT